MPMRWKDGQILKHVYDDTLRVGGLKEECASGTDFRTLIFLQFFANMLLVWIHFEAC